jgi:hypothetical protein
VFAGCSITDLALERKLQPRTLKYLPYAAAAARYRDHPATSVKTRILQSRQIDHREVQAHEVHAHEVHAHEMHTCEMHAYEGFCEDLARQNTVAHLSQRQLGFWHCRIWVSVLSYMGFSHRRSVLRPLFRTLHGLLGYQRSSALFRPVCLSSTCLSILFCRSDWLANPIACASFPRLALPLL